MKALSYFPIKPLRFLVISILLLNLCFLLACSKCCNGDEDCTGDESFTINESEVIPDCGPPGSTVLIDVASINSKKDLYSPLIDKDIFEDEVDKITCSASICEILVDGDPVDPKDYEYVDKAKGFLRNTILSEITLTIPSHLPEGIVEIEITLLVECEKKGVFAKNRSAVYKTKAKYRVVGTLLVPIAIDGDEEYPDYISTYPFFGDTCGGYTVKLMGRNFHTTDTAHVYFNGQLLLPDEIISYSSTEIEVIVPALPGPTPVPWGDQFVSVEVVNPPFDCEGQKCDPCWTFVYIDDPCINEVYESEFQGDWSPKGTNYIEIGYALEEEYQKTNDVVLANYDYNKIYIYEKDGTGLSTGIQKLRRFDYNLDSNPSELALGLFDRGNSIVYPVTPLIHYESVSILNTTYGEFEYIGVGESPNDVTTADIDSDTNIDIVVSNEGSNDIYLIKGENYNNFDSEIFNPITGLESSPIAIIEGNFDGGKGGDDIAVLLSNGYISLYISNYIEEDSEPLIFIDNIYLGEEANGIDIESGKYWDDEGFEHDHIAVLCSKGSSSKITFIKIDATEPYEIHFVEDEKLDLEIESTNPVVFRCGAIRTDINYIDFAIGNADGLIEILMMDDRSILERERINLPEGLTITDIALGVLKTNDGGYEDDLAIATAEFYLLTKNNIGSGLGFQE